MTEQTFTYDGERLMPDDPSLRNLLVEDISKFYFASRFAQGRTVLDAGCGAGQGTAHMAANGAQYVVGVDLSPEAVGYARSRWVVKGAARNLAFGCMNASELGFQDRSFDMVTSIEVIEHLNDPEGYLAEIRRLLRDGGILVLSTPNKRISSPTPGSMWPHHVREFYLDELKTILKEQFSAVEMWGLSIPVYDRHPVRRLVHLLAPIFKPVLPLGLRTRLLPTLQGRIKSDLTVEDVLISQESVDSQSTLMAVCRA